MSSATGGRGRGEKSGGGRGGGRGGGGGGRGAGKKESILELAKVCYIDGWFMVHHLFDILCTGASDDDVSHVLVHLIYGCYVAFGCDCMAIKKHRYFSIRELITTKYILRIAAWYSNSIISILTPLSSSSPLLLPHSI